MTENKKPTGNLQKQMIFWIGALIVGTLLGLLHQAWLDNLMTFIATVYTRLFQLIAVPTIVLAVITTGMLNCSQTPFILSSSVAT